MTIQIDDLGRIDGGSARLRPTMALAFAAAAALVASATGANAGADAPGGKSAWSYGPTMAWSARGRCRPLLVGRRNASSIVARPLGPTSFSGSN